MKLTPRVEYLVAKLVVGMHRRMSIAKAETHLLWQSFMPRKKEILNGEIIRTRWFWAFFSFGTE